jgi:ArsR family transcriptional regulator, zinc-responsive transcriptional repressor
MTVVRPDHGPNSARLRRVRAGLLGPTAESRLEQAREGLCQPTRAQIIRALSTSPLSVGDLARVVGRAKPAVSQHLRVLREAEIVTGRRRGRHVYYRLAEGPMVAALADLLATAASTE